MTIKSPAVSAKEKAREIVERALRYYAQQVGDGALAKAALAALSTEGEAEPVAWPKDPETGLNDLSLPTLLRMTRADASPPSAPAGVKDALCWAMDEIDTLSNKLCQFAYTMTIDSPEERQDLKETQHADR